MSVSEEDLPPILENQTAINSVMGAMGYKTKARSCLSCKFLRVLDRKNPREPIEYFCGISIAFVIRVAPDGVCRHWGIGEG